MKMSARTSQLLGFFLRIPNFILLSFVLIIVSCSDQNKVMIKEVRPSAPFEMPAITYPDFSRVEQFVITDFGAVEGDKETTSEAIGAAIDKASINGGRVVIPPGEWLTKAVHLKSNVDLHLEKGAILLFSEKPEDYLPAVHTSWEGMECYNYSPLVYAYESENVGISGEGELKAKLDVWKVWYKRPPAHMNSLKWLYMKAAEYSPVEERVMVNDTSNLRPHFIQFNRCNNVLLEGVKITNSPFWTIHPYMCKNVVVRDVHVFAHGHNNDGVDPEMTQNMLVENCYFDQGDDAFAIKSGRNQDAWRLATPTKNLVIRNCSIRNGHQLLAVGSELSGGVENVFLDSCTVADGASMFHLVFIKTNERRGGYVKNIHVSNVRADKMREGILGIETDVLYQWRDLVPTIERRLTPISDIYLSNIEANNVKFISRVLGQEELPVNNIHFSNVSADSIRSDQEIIHENLSGFQQTN
nr:glycoside hydrolase family 28 protein [uncultured Carboxylicivirga sp.]